jgi:hypothetical protein
MWPTTKPWVLPEKRPSVIRATSLPITAEVGASISRIPEPPLGPSKRMTITSPWVAVPSRMRRRASLSEPKNPGSAGKGWRLGEIHDGNHKQVPWHFGQEKRGMNDEPSDRAIPSPPKARYAHSDHGGACPPFRTGGSAPAGNPGDHPDDGIYEPRELNDRLLLGLKGTMSEFELGLSRQRARESLEQKVGRGHALRELPVGFIRTEDHRIEKIADRQVQQAIEGGSASFASGGARDRPRCGTGTRNRCFWR